MSAFSDDFDDGAEEDETAPLLPADDRIWRHPSEFSSSSSLTIDPLAVRRRWLASEPTRASAWTAGLVGAILATGLVVLGTRLATALTDRTGPTNPAVTAESSLPTSTVFAQSAPVVPATRSALSFTLSAALARSVAQVSSAMAVVDATFPRGLDLRCMSFVVESDGILLAPAESVVGATSIVVTLANGASYVGSVTAVDGAPHVVGTGLALIAIRADGLVTIPFDTRAPSRGGQLSLAVGLSHGHTAVYGGNIGVLDAAVSVGGWPIIDAMTVALPANEAPPGSAIVDDAGGVVGMVTGARGGAVVAVPAWLVAPVAKELVSNGKVSHGWLGISATTATSLRGVDDGARVRAVTRLGAASKAGIHRGDVIVAVGAHPIRSVRQLMGRLYVVPAGHRVRLTVQRGHERLHLLARLGSGARG